MLRSLAVVLEEPERLALATARRSTRRRRAMSSSRPLERRQRRHGAAALSPAACRLSPAWAIRWCPAMRPSATSSTPAPNAGAAGRRARVRSRRALLRRRARPSRRRGVASRRARRARRADRRRARREAACCSRSPRPRCTRSRRARPDGATLIVGHGVLGRLLARLAVARGRRAAVVWEKQPRARATARCGYAVIDARTTTRGATIARSSTSAATPQCSTRSFSGSRRGGEIVLAGFYDTRRASPSRRPSCARRASASPRNGREGDLARGRALVDVGRAVARRSHHPPPPGGRGARSLSDRVRRSALPQDGSRLEDARMSAMAF